MSDDDTPWLSCEEARGWVHLVGALMALPPTIDAQLKQDAGLNFFEYSILAELSMSPGRTRQMHLLAQLANGSQSRLSHAVRRLEKFGWVQRRACPTENRAVEAVLTDSGMAKVVETAPGHVREVRRTVIDVLSPQELEQLGQICRKVLAATSPQTLDVIDHAPPPSDGQCGEVGSRP
ncbi:MarR family winged helix-turn-helix transcriptional regulator [Streptomyces sp. NPDC057694]|uniref:MarR family winged helix-turn-helix transcriptional regulator n=1 Tax=Streptomyces sp. NPDC057694 TaxID=3346216 RepID=UPI0036A52C7A